jgi:hypothetical protein
MMRGASGDECGNLVLGQEYNRPAEAGVLKKPRGSDFIHHQGILYRAKKLHDIISQNRVNSTVITVRTLNQTFKEWQ